MWTTPGTPVSIHSSQLVMGLYVWLDLSWDDHPFISNRLLIKTQRDVTLIQALHVEGRLYYHPEKSTASPLPFSAPCPGSKAQAAAAAAAEIAEAIRPTALPPSVRTWLNPQQRLSCFYSVEQTVA